MRRWRRGGRAKPYPPRVFHRPRATGHTRLFQPHSHWAPYRQGNETEAQRETDRPVQTPPVQCAWPGSELRPAHTCPMPRSLSVMIVLSSHPPPPGFTRLQSLQMPPRGPPGLVPGQPSAPGRCSGRPTISSAPTEETQGVQSWFPKCGGLGEGKEPNKEPLHLLQTLYH